MTTAQWRERDPAFAKASNRRYFAKAVKEKRFYCAICDFAYKDNTSLKIHLQGPRHAARTARKQNPQKHYCPVCDLSFVDSWALKRHRKSSRHAAMAARNPDCQ